MESAVIASMAPNSVQRSGEGHRKGLCKEIEAREALLFSWGLHSLLNSHQSWEEAGQGLEDLLTVVASSLHPVPRPSLRGGRKRVKREIQGLRAKPPPIFIAGELEICLSLPTLGRWTLRGPIQQEVTLGAPTPLMAMPGLSWATSGPWRPKVSLVFQGQSQPPPETRASGSGLGPVELGSGQ